MRKKTISVILVLVMILGFFVVPVSANEFSKSDENAIREELQKYEWWEKYKII